MKNLKFILSVLTVLLLSEGIKAQQEPQFAQYFDVLQQTNSAYTGVKEVMNVTLLHREQWVGFEGRPRSTSLTFQTPTKYKSV